MGRSGWRDNSVIVNQDTHQALNYFLVDDREMCSDMRIDVDKSNG